MDVLKGRSSKVIQGSERKFSYLLCQIGGYLYNATIMLDMQQAAGNPNPIPCDSPSFSHLLVSGMKLIRRAATGKNRRSYI